MAVVDFSSAKEIHLQDEQQDPALGWPAAMPQQWCLLRDASLPTATCIDGLDALRSRAEGAYLGLAIGDALGATTEFLTPREIKAFHGTHKDMVGGGWLNLKAGNVTDDTEMALALGQAILSRGGQVCARSIAESFSAWMSSKPVDIGHTVRRGISSYRRNGQPWVADNEQLAGNGAAMRCLPIALITYGAPWGDVIDAMRRQAHVTHTCQLADAGCEIVIALVQMALTAPRANIGDLARLIEDFCIEWPQFSPEGKRMDDPTGFIVHTLKAVFQVISEGHNFESGLIDIVNRGGDADTTGAILGMILGALYGPQAIPKRWLKRLNPKAKQSCIKQAGALIAYAPAVLGKA